MATSSHTGTSGYYLPAPSHWPVVGSVAIFLLALSGVLLLNGVGPGLLVLVAGFAILLYFLIGWFSTVIRESESGLYNKQVDISYRWSMSWFIFSEVMFFAAFFGALFYMRSLSVPWLSEGDTGELLWPAFKSQWPVSGPGIEGTFTPMGAWGIPAINTLILLTSGLTVTWAHWGLKKNNRAQLNFGLFLTIVLGITFLALQAYEYIHAYHELNLTLAMGAYGATFFMLTGFHGFHVTLGTIMLIVILMRALKGHFTPERHFAFEGVSWYWHFVDVVWLLLFVLVYWL
ncbi:MAG TPA: cytochrome c oxidase subunit 3 [Burkholderiales bacterium]|nr:cytochrome c oxidase subunit 3 [Burkholderiales bacterium]